MKAGRDLSAFQKTADNEISNSRKYIKKDDETGKPIPWSNKHWVFSVFTIKAWGTKGYK